jgi:hypothetical protein
MRRKPQVPPKGAKGVIHGHSLVPIIWPCLLEERASPKSHDSRGDMRPPRINAKSEPMAFKRVRAPWDARPSAKLKMLWCVARFRFTQPFFVCIYRENCVKKHFKKDFKMLFQLDQADRHGRGRGQSLLKSLKYIYNFNFSTKIFGNTVSVVIF